MSSMLRFWSFAGVLGVVVSAAVVVTMAQVPSASPPAPPAQAAPPAPPVPPAPPAPPAWAEHRAFTMLDGRGSRLGVLVQDLAPAESGEGVRIDTVDAGSPAEKAGLEAGDVVVEFDGERVRSARQFTRLVQETAEGRAVPLAVLRDGQRRALTATPEARASTWHMDLDGDRIRRDIERGIEGLRGFRLDGAPGMRFRIDREPAALGSSPGRGRLGVQVDSLSDQLAQYFGAGNGGALVTRVEPDSPAARAGLKAGDVITAINGDTIRDADELAERVGRAGDHNLSVGYLRDKASATATVTLEPRTPRAAPREQRRPVRPARFMRPA